MPDAETDKVTCPSCGKGYRWKPVLVGRLVPCRKCGTEFTVPRHPGVGQALDSSDDGQDSVYALAVDIDDLPEPAVPPPPAAMVDQTDHAEAARHEPPAPAVKTNDVPTGASPGGTGESDDASDEPAHVSEAAKAKRREEQRLAAAAAEPARSWRDYKLLIILGGLIVVVALAVWVLTSVSDALDGILG
ncbi:MAG: hypothetical protein ACE37H_09350 [Phycisphaeraceae bacterium]